MSLEKKIVVLSGAGISAESGIKTFRDGGGLWENHAIEDVATPEGFRRNPDLVYRFYEERRKQLLDPSIKPNAAHKALVALENACHENFLLITQNVDNLHERAGSKNIIHMHGELLKTYCQSCNFEPMEGATQLHFGISCPSCGTLNSMRPDVVWFGEIPKMMEEIEDAIQDVGIFIAVGTSGQVYPAASFVRWAKHAQPECRTIEVNLIPSSGASYFDEHCTGPASETLPKLVDVLLKS